MAHSWLNHGNLPLAVPTLPPLKKPEVFTRELPTSLDVDKLSEKIRNQLAELPLGFVCTGA